MPSRAPASASEPPARCIAPTTHGIVPCASRTRAGSRCTVAEMAFDGDSAGAPLVALDHEELVVRRGRRSGAYTIVAVHSTALGPAVGGCRMWRYVDSAAAARDALRLSRAMTFKNAAAGPGDGRRQGRDLRRPRATARGRSAARDAARLRRHRERARRPLRDRRGRRHERRRHGDSRHRLLPRQRPRARGAAAAATRARSPPRASRPPCAPASSGASRRAAATWPGAAWRSWAPGTSAARWPGGWPTPARGVTMADIDPARRALADELGADWVEPTEALRAEVDVLAPCALGGVLDQTTIPHLRAPDRLRGGQQPARPRRAGRRPGRARDPLRARLRRERGRDHQHLRRARARRLRPGESPPGGSRRSRTRSARCSTTPSATGVSPLAAAYALARRRLQEAENSLNPTG